MAEFVGSRAGFWIQSNALLRKNLTFQKRRICANLCLIAVPGIFCALFFALQTFLFVMALQPARKICEGRAKIKISSIKDGLDFGAGGAPICATPSTLQWPALVRIPSQRNRAVRSDSFPFQDLPDDSCRKDRDGDCPVTILMTGNNQTFAQDWANTMFTPGGFPENSTGNITDWTKNVVGSEYDVATVYGDPAFLKEDKKLYNLQDSCENDDGRVPEEEAALQLDAETTVKPTIKCLECLISWRNSSSEINDELFKGQQEGNKEKKVNEILAAYDISNSEEGTGLNLTVWYNSTKTERVDQLSRRVPRLVNMASNAYLALMSSDDDAKFKIELDYLKEMPKGFTANIPDMTSLIGPLFFSWVVLQLFPVVLASLVYEKRERLRMMMKMHGLGDGPYWLIQYAYFLVISVLYIICFVLYGTILGLPFFYKNEYSLQFTFYILFVNLQIAVAFLMSSMFKTTRSATVVAYVFVFGGGLMGQSFFSSLVMSDNVSRGWIIFLELYPGFSLYRGLFDIGQYTFEAENTNSKGMTWGNLNDSGNGMKEILIIMALEFVVLMPLAYYLDQITTGGKSPLFFLQRKKVPALNTPSMQRTGSKGLGDMDRPDVVQEKERVEELMAEAKYSSHVVICDNIKKVYPGIDGNPEKFAVRGLSLALPQGECFGMLGPSGAGKTSFIEMMIGLTRPSTGTAYVQGLDIVTQMHEIHACIGVCPQHDLLWATLTGREHLLFYGRLKNLRGSELTKAVEDSLKSLNLFYGGVADKRAGQYSGGMKRRLSVAIALIGNPIAVYMDEPSTGLDPASRNTLWNVIKLAKQGRAIILTTHSMEEAEFLCDRIGIFVDGRLQCIGNPKELKGRYGGVLVFTITTDLCHEQEVEGLILRLAADAVKVYHLAGTQKFEFPKSEVRIAGVFEMVERIKKMFTVYAWGLADTTLEDVFIKVAGAPKKLELIQVEMP